MPTYLDLFAGAGGLSEGFIRAGYEPVAHVEMDVAACYTLKTRTAYHWLRNNDNLTPYMRYLYGDITRESTTKRKKEYKETHPLFTKTDLAKYENTWDQLP